MSLIFSLSKSLMPSGTLWLPMFRAMFCPFLTGDGLLKSDLMGDLFSDLRLGWDLTLFVESHLED